MPSTAPNACSLPQLASVRQAKPAIEITRAKARVEARMRVVYDRSLSPGARLLYVALDDYAGMNGEAWPHQKLLSSQMGVCERQVKRWFAELAKTDYIACRRTQHGNRYSISWRERKSMVPVEGVPLSCSEINCDTASANVPSQGTFLSPGIPFSEPNQEPVCSRCRDELWAASAEHGGRRIPCSCPAGRALAERLNPWRIYAQARRS